MHERFFKLTGVTCPKCGSKVLQSSVNGTNHTVSCPDCTVWSTAGTHEAAIKLAIDKLISEIDPNLRVGKQSVVKSVVSSLVELPGGVIYNKLTGETTSGEVTTSVVH